MTDNELLLAMSDLLDTKLKAELQPIRDDIHILKKDVQMLKSEMQEVKMDLCQVKLYQENILEPRLNTIEACYTSTYDRYRRDAERMETAFSDIEVLKRTVENHSIQLQRLA